MGLVELTPTKIDKTATPFGRLAGVARQLQREGSAFTWPSKRYQRDPVAFAREVLGIEKLWSKQIEMLEALRDHPRVAVRSGHKVSKSHTLAIAALWFFSSFEDARVFATCVTARQVDEIFYRECKRMHMRARVPLSGSPAQKASSGIRSADGREIQGFTARQVEGVAGISGANVLFLVDEASGVEDGVFEALEGNRAGGARMFMVSNPTQCEGTFADAFESNAKFWHCIGVSSEESPNVVEGREVIPGLATRAWVDEKREEWGEDSALYRVRVKGEFVRQEEGKICSLHALAMAETRNGEISDEGRLQVGVDPAGDGEDGDETAIVLRRGLRHVASYAFRGLAEPVILATLKGILVEHLRPRERPIVVVDREGRIGATLFGLMRAEVEEVLSWDLVGIRSSERASREPMLYERVRDELWAAASAYFREGGGLLPDAKLCADLHSASWEGQVSGRVKATDKRAIKKKLGRSPDRGDAFCLSVWPVRGLEAVEAAAFSPAAKVAAAKMPEPAADFGPAQGVNPYDALAAWERV